MRKPPEDVVRGLRVLIPAIDVMLQTPSCSMLQDCSDQEIEDATKALQWIANLVNDSRRNPKDKPCSP